MYILDYILLLNTVLRLRGNLDLSMVSLPLTARWIG